MDADAVLSRLSDVELPGVHLASVEFTPHGAGDRKYEGVPVRGIRLGVTDRSLYDPTRTAVALLVEIRKVAGADWEWRPATFDRLAGTDRLRLAVDSQKDVDAIVSGWAEERDRFQRTRSRYLLYP